MQLVKRMQWVTLALATMVIAVPGYAQNEDIKIQLEEPVANSVYANVGNIRGWVVAKEGVSDQV
ncbi:MAG: hypothetical protein OIF38_09895 [Cellvibrionaceae bacterium]|nr:hypothetical protein [Cellvibrionaceae bacterium]